MQSDVLIIGSGGAGLSAALNAHKLGAKVKVVSKEYPTRSQTCMAQGGINAALGNMKEDSVESHIQNTLKSAHALANESQVRVLCQEAPNAIEWLDSIGVCFSRTSESKIAQRTLGGASAPRACYAQDYTGLKILHTLYDNCLKEGIEMLSEYYLLELLTDKERELRVVGAAFLNIRTGEVESFYAKSVIVATGGYSRIYGKYSTNSSASTGDGVAAALRAGANISDMEFVQFHPTALKNSSVLISESARGAGGYLLNSQGERFTNELAPRDEVARAIYSEMQKGEEIFLDIRHLGEEFINEELPQERKLAKLYESVDPLYELIPIKPAAHYTMGGIDVDENSETSMKGLFAVGECANHHVHGANRLGGNSLLEIVVFGKEVAKSAFEYSKNAQEHRALTSQINPFEKVKEYSREIDFYKVKEQLGDIFYSNMGIVREKNSLERALEFVLKNLSEVHKMGINDSSKIYNTNLVEFLEFINTLELSKVMLQSALAREESRGAHFRSDFTQESDTFAKSSIYNKNGVVA